MLELPLDHVAIAVPSIADAAPSFERLSGAACSAVEAVAGQGVRVAFIGALELIEPTDADTPVGRFLQTRGSGLHHVAYRTADIEGELARVRAAGFEAIDAAPRRGARGHRVAFLHPRSTGGVLVELVEHPR
jgi:methylmalonyl-CoA epimerase